MAFSNFASWFGGRRAASTFEIGRGHHYDPDQPRVPAGNPDGGQWTIADAVHEDDNDERVVLSDATPDNDWKPGAQYAGGTRRSGRGGNPPTAGQLVRLTFAEARAKAAVRAVQEREPLWRPTPSIYSSVEGHIATLEARAQEAESRLQELTSNGIGPGPFARESIPARGPSRYLDSNEREQHNRNGDNWGCHTCGTKDPGNAAGNWVRDHQPSNALNEFFKRAQRIFPHCPTCSNRQGAWITNWIIRNSGERK